MCVWGDNVSQVIEVGLDNALEWNPDQYAVPFESMASEVLLDTRLVPQKLHIVALTHSERTIESHEFLNLTIGTAATQLAYSFQLMACLRSLGL